MSAMVRMPDGRLIPRDIFLAELESKKQKESSETISQPELPKEIMLRVEEVRDATEEELAEIDDELDEELLDAKVEDLNKLSIKDLKEILRKKQVEEEDIPEGNRKRPFIELILKLEGLM